MGSANFPITGMRLVMAFLTQLTISAVVPFPLEDNKSQPKKQSHSSESSEESANSEQSKSEDNLWTFGIGPLDLPLNYIDKHEDIHKNFKDSALKHEDIHKNFKDSS